MSRDMKRAAALRKALEEADTMVALSNVRELIPDEGRGAQEVFAYAFACVLETNAAGLSILFERFDENALHKIRGALHAIGAPRTLGDFDTLHAMFATALADGSDRVDASEWLSEQQDTRRIDRDYGSHTREMERQLFDYSRAHVEELAVEH